MLNAVPGFLPPPKSFFQKLVCRLSCCGDSSILPLFLEQETPNDFPHFGHDTVPSSLPAGTLSFWAHRGHANNCARMSLPPCARKRLLCFHWFVSSAESQPAQECRLNTCQKHRTSGKASPFFHIGVGFYRCTSVRDRISLQRSGFHGDSPRRYKGVLPLLALALTWRLLRATAILQRPHGPVLYAKSKDVSYDRWLWH